MNETQASAYIKLVEEVVKCVGEFIEKLCAKNQTTTFK